MTRILVVEDERPIRWRIMASIEEAELGTVTEAADIESARRVLVGSRFDLVVLDLGLPRSADDPEPRPVAGLELLDEIRSTPDDAPDVIVVTAEASTEVAVDAMRRGARDYLKKPFDPLELRRRLENVLSAGSRREEVRALRQVVERASGVEAIVYGSAAMQKVVDRIRRVARGDSTILVRGETGTGKELVARAIHFASPRADAPYVTIDTPAIPSNLLEDELFGHVKGAFTSAAGSRRGKVELARGGTLFFDEIGDMASDLQAKILRLLQERQFQPVGGEQRLDADLRVIAATHQDLEKGVSEGSFREDLYYRLNVVPIDLPPLRERSEDVLPLAHSFLEKFNRRLGTRIAGFDDAAAERLSADRWAGNVRELHNVVEQVANLVEEGHNITLEDVEAALASSARGARSCGGSLGAGTESNSHNTGAVVMLDDGFPPMEGDLGACVERLEGVLIRRALTRARGNKTKAAALLGISRPALYARLERQGLTETEG